MLPVENRLKINKAQSYRWVNKRQLYTPFFKIVFRFGNKEQEPKFGFITPGKIKGAVKRNKIRRYFVEAIGKNIEKLPKSLEAIIIADKKAAEVDHDEISDWIDKTLPKIYKPRP